MYFIAVKNVLDHCIPQYAQRFGLTVEEVYRRIGEHIEKTRNEHRSPDPSIDYEDPLCRLGYLYVHVGANAALFEKSLSRTRHLATEIENASSDVLTVCAVGGGPGTELLGLARFIAETIDTPPSRLSFTVLDRVSQWGESWSILADQCRSILQARFHGQGFSPSVESNFQPIDVTDPSSYGNYGWLFSQTDIFVFNYLVSENKVRMDAFRNALAAIVAASRSGSTYVFIDRLEADGAFSTSTKQTIQDVGLTSVKDFEIDGCMADSESDLGDYPQQLNARPRRWFRTRYNRDPTVFVVVAQKP
jgi:hypothetical protein